MRLNTNHLMNTNPIVITEFDRRRLERLLDVLRVRPGVDASCLDELEEELERADVVAPHEVPANVVTMNSRALLADLDTGEMLDVTLVFPGAAQTEAARISVLAPLGLALLGGREGESVCWPTPSRVRHLRVERVLYQPEAAGNFSI